MPFSEAADEEPLKLVNPDSSQQEFFALPDMQGNRMSAIRLVLKEVLKGVAAIGGYMVNEGDITREIDADRFRVAPAVMRLTRVPPVRWIVPAELLIVVLRVAVANFGIVLGAPNVTLNPKGLLPKLVDQACKGPKQTLFHACSQRAKALRVGVIFLKDGRQTLIPLAQCLLFRIRNITEVGFRHQWHGVRRRQSIQQHLGVFRDDSIQLVREIGPQGGIAGKKRLDRDGGAVAVALAVVPRDDVLAASAMFEEFPKIVLHGTSHRPAEWVV